MTTTTTNSTLLDPSSRDSYIVALSKTGASYEDIGTQVGLTRERVRQILKDKGISRMSTTLVIHNKIRELSRCSMTVSEIAAEVNKPVDYVDHFCRQHRLRVPRNRRISPDGTHVNRVKPSDLLEQVRQRVADGLTTAQIAVELNQLYHTIYSLRKRNEI
jgi:DNA-binding CsgD family transcriptional regulator